MFLLVFLPQFTLVFSSILHFLLLFPFIIFFLIFCKYSEKFSNFLLTWEFFFWFETFELDAFSNGKLTLFFFYWHSCRSGSPVHISNGTCATLLYHLRWRRGRLLLKEPRFFLKNLSKKKFSHSGSILSLNQDPN